MTKTFASFAEFYPFYSFGGDWVMYRDMLTGRIEF